MLSNNPITRPFGKCRKQEFMPQLDLRDYPAFIEWAKSHGVYVRHALVHPGILRSIQCWGPWVKHVVQEHTLAKPVIVSGDKIVLDGNRRWINHIRQGSQQIPCYTLHLDLVEAIHFMFEFPRTYKLGDGITEERN